MKYELERINRVIKDIERYMYSDKEEITIYKVKEGNFKGGEVVGLDDSDWADYQTGSLWGGYDRHMWFRTNFSLPERFRDKFVIFRINTGHKEGWDISNPQFLSYINGKIVQGLDVNHRNLIIDREVLSQADIHVALLGYSGLNQEKVFLKTEILVIDKEIENLYYNLKNLFWAACVLEVDDINRLELMKSLEVVMSKLDLRKIYSEDFYKGIREANNYLVQKFYTIVNYDKPIVTMIGHTHIDIAWLWTVSQTREKVVRSFSTVLYLMNQYPEYKFMSSQPQLYQFLKEEEPELYEKVKEKVREGRWEVDGAMWVEADCNLSSGESLVRQLLYGTRFIKQEFNVDCKTLWLPDVFGYSAVLPQLLKNSGINYFFTTKLDWNQYNKMPHDTFMWRGIDGSEIFTQLVTTTNHMNFENEVLGRRNTTPQTTYNGRLNTNQILGNWSRYQDKNINNETIQLFGFGDGGGGPTEEMLQNYERLKYGLPGLPRANMDFQGQFFDRVYDRVKDNPDLKKWVGELYFECHRGTYTPMAKNKRFNRKAEYLYQDVETLQVWASLLGETYPVEEIHKGWKTILTNQFHDIIPGTSIEKVYEQTDEEYAAVFKSGNEMLRGAMEKLAAHIHLDNQSIILFNTLSHTRSDIVEIEIPEELRVITLKDEVGNNIPVQFVAQENKIVFFATDVPAKGYKAYEIVRDSWEEAPNMSTLEGHRIETDFYKVVFDEQFQITSIYDKVCDREVIAENKKANVFEIFEDRPMNFENWDIDIYYKKKMYIIDHLKEVKVVENGPIRTGIQIVREYYESTITQIIYLYKDSSRIDFKTHIDWHEKHVLLKVAFPIDVNADKATFEIQYGNVERSTHDNTSWDLARFEVCAHKWIDLSDAGYGVSLLNDCKYGHDIKDNIMKITLIKCGEYPNVNADIGHHEFTYSVYAHEGTWREARTSEEAYNLNVPMHSIIQEARVGGLQKAMSFISVDKENCIIEAIKKQEDGEGTIVRVFENENKRVNVTFKTCEKIKTVYECDLLENKIQEIEPKEKNFSSQIKPYEIKTFVITFEK